MEEAHPHSGSSSTLFLIELEFGNVFEERGKPEYPEKNLSEQGENQQQTQPTYGVYVKVPLHWTSPVYLSVDNVLQVIK